MRKVHPYSPDQNQNTKQIDLKNLQNGDNKVQVIKIQSKTHDKRKSTEIQRLITKDEETPTTKCIIF